MQILIRSAKVISPGSVWNGKTTDILIDNGIVTEIKHGIRATKAREIKYRNLHVSPGWFDMQANFRDPGMEYKEDISSGCAAAAAGGFTGVCLMPSTTPAVQTKADVEYVLNKSRSEIVDVYPAGALSVGLEGKDLAEMFDMRASGAIAFTDDKNAIKDAGLLVRAMQYCNSFNSLVMVFCNDPDISLDGKMNESPASTKLGLKGIPALAEEIMVARNIFIAEYCNSPIHLMSVSTAGSVDLIREAKQNKIKVTASVNAHSLLLSDNMLEEFDSNLKVNPPLRSKKDLDALRKGLADGTIDVIVSDHSPEDVEHKVIEFDNAAFGMSCIETSFSLAMMAKGSLSLDKLISKISINPRKILGLKHAEIRKGAEANLTLFDPSGKWTPTAAGLRSKSKNDPMIGKLLTSRVYGIINGTKASF